MSLVAMSVLMHLAALWLLHQVGGSFHHWHQKRSQEIDRQMGIQ